MSPLRRRRLSPDEWYPAGRTNVAARFVTLADGERVRIVEAGPPSGTPVLLLHGWGASAYSFRRLIPLLVEAGLRAIAVDLRGHGRSDRPAAPGAYSAAALVQYVLRLLDRMGIARAVLVGQSMSGAVALDVWFAAPDRVMGAVLLAPIGFTTLRRIAVARLARARHWSPDRVPRWVVTLLLRRVYGRRGTWDGRDVDEYWWPLHEARTTASLMALVTEFDWMPRDPGPAAHGVPPLRVLLGERDKLISWSRATAWARRIPAARVTVVPGAGHLLAEEVPEETAREIVAVADSRPAP
ncbi:MAG TPA: alpha/beta hydrolase [Gemmatimonadaceae bacterium]|nr:alpha/beta hydrolase [Gemmatimonadaceae bacterium]